MVTKYTIANGVEVIRKPITYVDGDLVYGERIGLYQANTGDILIPDEQEWSIIDGLNNNSKNENVEYINDLIANNILLKDNEQLKVEAIFIPKHITVYVSLTEACNFACPGCATSSDLIKPSEAKNLDIKTLSRYLSKIVSSAHQKGIKNVTIKWAGGEPLLHIPYQLIKEAQNLITSLQKEFTPMTIKQVLITNGVYINDEKLDFFSKIDNIFFSISLWGTKKYQDVSRRPRNNLETFEFIAQNIVKTYLKGIPFNVNHVLTPGNARGFKDFIELLWDVESKNFIGYGKNIQTPISLATSFFRAQTKVQAQVMQRVGYKKMEQGMKEAFAYIIELIDRGIKMQALAKFDYLDLFTVIPTTCGSGFNYIAVGPRGIASCHEGMYNLKENNERLLDSDNIIDAVNHAFYPDNKKLYGPNIKFKHAGHLALHGAQGCPRLAKKENGELGYASSTSMLYEAIYKDMLSLETYRQLKFGSI